MVQPIMSDCDTSFSPLGIDNREPLKRLQRRAERSIYGFQPHKLVQTLRNWVAIFQECLKGYFTVRQLAGRGPIRYMHTVLKY